MIREDVEEGLGSVSERKMVVLWLCHAFVQARAGGVYG